MLERVMIPFIGGVDLDEGMTPVLTTQEIRVTREEVDDIFNRISSEILRFKSRYDLEIQRIALDPFEYVKLMAFVRDDKEFEKKFSQLGYSVFPILGGLEISGGDAMKYCEQNIKRREQAKKSS